MKKANPSKRRESRRAVASGEHARQGGQTLTTHNVGALPLLNRAIERMKLEEFLEEYLPPEDGRTKIPNARALLVLVRNLLVSREPLYGVGEWAARQAPELLGLSPEQVAKLNDDRCGRAVDKLFACDQPSLLLALVAHTVRQFAVALDELHNDGTSVSVYGAYAAAARQRRQRGRVTPAVTFGHSKDHRPEDPRRLPGRVVGPATDRRRGRGDVSAGTPRPAQPEDPVSPRGPQTVLAGLGHRSWTYGRRGAHRRHLSPGHERAGAVRTGAAPGL